MINMMLDQELKREILNFLKGDKVHRVILFGSYADGTFDSNSDIDLVIVTDNEGMSKNYEDYLDNKSTFSKKLISIRRKYPLDIIVYSKDEWNFIKACKTSFIKSIEEEGIDLL